MFQLRVILLLRCQGDEGPLPGLRYLSISKEILYNSHNFELDDRPVPLEKERREAIWFKGFILSQRSHSSPNLIRSHGLEKLLVFLLSDYAARWWRHKWSGPSQGHSPPWFEEVHNLLSNPSLLRYPLPLRVSQGSDLIPMPTNNHGLMEEPCISISLLGSLGSWLLHPKDLLLSKKRVMLRNLLAKLK